MIICLALCACLSVRGGFTAPETKSLTAYRAFSKRLAAAKTLSIEVDCDVFTVESPSHRLTRTQSWHSELVYDKTSSPPKFVCQTTAEGRCIALHLSDGREVYFDSASNPGSPDFRSPAADFFYELPLGLDGFTEALRKEGGAGKPRQFTLVGQKKLARFDGRPALLVTKKTLAKPVPGRKTLAQAGSWKIEELFLTPNQPYRLLGSRATYYDRKKPFKREVIRFSGLKLGDKPLEGSLFVWKERELPAEGTFVNLKPGNKAPLFTAPTYLDQRISLQAELSRAKAILLVFWYYT